MDFSQKLRRESTRVARQAIATALRPVALVVRNRFLFILAHMRSGSSLLGHLLCSSPDIVGYGETHNDYRRRSDLAKLLVSIRWNTGQNPLRYRYVLDKLVSMQDVIGPAVLTDPRTRYIFLIREPLATVSSLVAMRRRECTDSDDELIAFAASNYVARLRHLMQLAEQIGNRRRSILVTYQQLIETTPAAFAALERFLQLRAPLREDYQVMPTTGRPGIGDPSPNIRIGRIERSLSRSPIELPAPVQEMLRQCYADCVGCLGTNAQSIALDACGAKAA